MKKLIYFLIIVVVASLQSCTTNEDVTNNIVGAWVLESLNNVDVQDNDKFVMIFNADGTQSFGCGYQMSSTNNTWAENNFVYTIEKNGIIIEGDDYRGNHYIIHFKITHIDRECMQYKHISETVNGINVEDNTIYKCERADDIYKNELLGVWEGRNVTPGATSTDLIRIQYLENGRYNYYIKDQDESWKLKDATGEYFLYGDVIATMWAFQYSQTEIGPQYEVWEIEIDDNVMEWKARRSENKMNYFSFTRIQ